MKYRTIVADPPWDYSDGWPGNGWSGRQENRADLPYPSMTLGQIAAIPVTDLAEKDAHLFLWTTNRYLRESYTVAEWWGFKPSQLLTWCKPPAGIGPGGLFAQTTEFIIYARRGKPESVRRQPSSWWVWPRRGHSVKPEAFLDEVEAACSGPYLELFARRNRLGWDTWGNESLEHVAVEARNVDSAGGPMIGEVAQTGTGLAPEPVQSGATDTRVGVGASPTLPDGRSSNLDSMQGVER